MPNNTSRVHWQLVFLLFGLLCVAAGYATAFLDRVAVALSASAMAIGIALLIPSVMALGAPLSSSRKWVVRGILLGVFALLAVAFLAALWLPNERDGTARLVWGFPFRTAVVVYGAGLLPMLVLPLLYAATFDSTPDGTEDRGS
jgi:uncharacterized membrane protein HdeD (DUF308 family)